MPTLGTRRAVLVAGVATVAAALTGCGAGQVAETTLKNASVYGVNAQSANGSVLIRGLAVVYNGTEGYPAGSTAPIELNLYNETKAPITVLVSSQPPDAAVQGKGTVAARSVTIVGGQPSAPSTAIPQASGSRAAATPDSRASDTASQPPTSQPSVGASGSGTSAQPSVGASGSGTSAQPSAAASTGRPARIQIGPLGYTVFRSGSPETLQAVGLTDRLAPGNSLNLVFEFGDGSAPLVVQAPVAIPLTPASRAPGNPSEYSGESNEGEEN